MTHFSVHDKVFFKSKLLKQTHVSCFHLGFRFFENVSKLPHFTLFDKFYLGMTNNQKATSNYMRRPEDF